MCEISGRTGGWSVGRIDRSLIAGLPRAITLLIIEHEYQSRHALRASVAEQVIRQHPTISILLARPPAAS